jgi:hypothetical protein
MILSRLVSIDFSSVLDALPDISAVGTRIAARPPLRSRRAQLTHRAPTSGA